MFRTFFTAFIALSLLSFQDPLADADALLKKLSANYKKQSGWKITFTLTVMQPKRTASDDEMKNAQQLAGTLKLKNEKFQLDLDNQRIWCNGKNTWTLLKKEKEVQLNEYTPTDDVFSPSKIFSFYTTGFLYRIKETYKSGNRSFTVIELTPQDKKVSFFKIDLTVDDAFQNISSVKLYEKSGVRYLYNITKQQAASFSDNEFEFDAAKNPGIKVIDLR